MKFCCLQYLKISCNSAVWVQGDKIQQGSDHMWVFMGCYMGFYFTYG